MAIRYLHNMCVYRMPGLQWLVLQKNVIFK